MVMGKEEHSRQREQNRGHAEGGSNVLEPRDKEKGVLGSRRSSGPAASGISLRRCL